MYHNMEENTDKQKEKQGTQSYDWIRGYMWKKGQSGNPNGRPKGKTLKTFAREYLESLPDEEKIEYLKTLPTEIVWKMAEGNPDTKSENTLKGDELQPVLVKFITGDKPSETPNADNRDTK